MFNVYLLHGKVLKQRIKSVTFRTTCNEFRYLKTCKLGKLLVNNIN